MVGVCGPQPYDRAVLMIKPPPQSRTGCIMSLII